MTSISLSLLLFLILILNFFLPTILAQSQSEVSPKPKACKAHLLHCGHKETQKPTYMRSLQFVISADLSVCQFPIKQINWELFKGGIKIGGTLPQNHYIIFPSRSLHSGQYKIIIKIVWEPEPGVLKFSESSDTCYFEVKDHPPVAIIQGGRSRNVTKKPSGVILNGVPSYNLDFNILTSEKVKYLRYYWILVETKEKFEGPIWHYKVHRIQLNKEYHFRLTVFNIHTDQWSKIFEQIITFTDKGLELELECFSNCKKFNPGDSVIFKCSCANCRKVPKYRFKYPVTKSKYRFSDKWKAPGFLRVDLASENDIKVMLAKSGSKNISNLTKTKKETFFCEANQGDLAGSAKYTFQINTPPKTGKCSVSPGSGIFHENEFVIDCVDFGPNEKFNFYASISHLKGISEKKLRLLRAGGADDGDQKRILIFYDSNPKTPGLLIPHGTDKILVQATNQNGQSTKISISVQVGKPADLKKNLDELVKKVEKSLEFGDQQKVLQIQMGLLVLMISQEGSYGLGPDIDQEILKNISEILLTTTTKNEKNGAIYLNSYQSLEQVISIVQLMIENCPKEKLHINNFNKISLVLGQVSRKFKDFANSESEESILISNENFDLIAKKVLDSTSYLIQESHRRGLEIMSNSTEMNNSTGSDESGSETENMTQTGETLADLIDRDYILDEVDLNMEQELSPQESLELYEEIAQNLFRALTNILDAKGINSQPFGDRQTSSGDILTMSVETFVPAELSGLLITQSNTTEDGLTRSGENENSSKPFQVILPEGIEFKSQSQTLQIQTIETELNPFFDNSTGLNMVTKVVSVFLKDGFQQVQFPPNESQFFDIFIPYPVDQEEFEVDPISFTLTAGLSLDEVTDDQINIFKFDLPLGSEIILFIFDLQPGVDFVVVHCKNAAPTRKSLCSENATYFPSNGNETEDGAIEYVFTTDRYEEPSNEFYANYFISIWPVKSSNSDNFENPEYPENDTETETETETVVVSLALITRTCVSRDESLRSWVERGCIVGKNSTEDVLHCVCNHFSVFGGAHFVMPMTLQDSKDFAFSYKDFVRNPIVPIAVAVVLILYLLAIIWLCLVDRKDRIKHKGFVIMTDVNEDILGEYENFYYIITAFTGKRFWSGTKSNISMRIYGSSGRSEAFCLKTKGLHTLYRGSADNFLVSSRKNLGKIESILLWSDNSGSNPDWFCRKLIIHDVQTKAQTFFYIDKWISGEEGTLTAQVEANKSAKIKNIFKRFSETFSDQLISSHLWLSPLIKPPGSYFTRGQRITCAFAVMAAYMLIFIMFFGVPINDPNSIFEAGELHISWLHIFRSLEISLMCAPFGIILSTLFKSTRLRYVPTLCVSKYFPKKHESNSEYLSNITKSHIFTVNSAGEYNYDRVVQLPHLKKFNPHEESKLENTFKVPTSDKLKPQTEAWIYKDSKGDNSRAKQSYDKPEPDGFVHSFEDDLERKKSTISAKQIDFLKLGNPAQISAIKLKNPQAFMFDGNSDEDIEQLIERELEEYNKVQSPLDNLSKKEIKQIQDQIDNDKIKTKYSNKPPIKAIHGHYKDQDESSEGLTKLELYKMAPKSKKKFGFLPWWFLYINWGIALATIGLCSLFTIFYGFKIGYLRSYGWIRGVVVHMFFSIIIFQPLNAFIMSLFYVVFYKEIQTSGDQRFQIIRNAKCSENLEPLEYKIFRPSKSVDPLKPAEIYKLKMKLRRKVRVREAFKYFILYFILILVLFLITHILSHDYHEFLAVRRIKKIFRLEESGGRNGHRHKGKIHFDMIENDQMFYSYMEDTFLQGLYLERHPNGNKVKYDKSDVVYTTDDSSFIVGVPRIRQVRVKPDGCNNDTSKYCDPLYGISTQDQDEYNSGWEKIGKGQKRYFKRKNDIWKFIPSNSTQSLKQWGKLSSVYDGGGYIVELARESRNTKFLLQYMKKKLWIDSPSRGIFIEFSIFNPSMQFFIVCLLAVEKSVGGSIRTWSQVRPVTLTNSVKKDFFTKDLNLILFCYIMLGLCAAALLCQFLVRIFQPRKKIGGFCARFAKFWIWFEILLIILLISTCGVIIKRNLVIEQIENQLRSSSLNQFVNLQEAAFWDLCQNSLLSFDLFLSILMAWKLLVFTNETFTLMTITIRLVSRFLFGILLLFFILLCAFVVCGILLFGEASPTFSTPLETLFSLRFGMINSMVLQNFFPNLKESHPLIGPVYFFIYCFIQLMIIYHMVIGILNQGFKDAKEIMKQQEKSEHPYLSLWCKGLMGRFSKGRLRRSDDRLEIHPSTVLSMKMYTAMFIRKCLEEREVRKMNYMKKLTNDYLVEKHGKKYQMISIIEKVKNIRSSMNREIPEDRLDQMRSRTIEFIRKKKQLDYTGEEVKKYSDFNLQLLELKLKNLEDKLNTFLAHIDSYVTKSENKLKKDK